MNKKIQAANAKFAKLGKAEKRVQIAKDVISSLKSRKMSASPGVYFRSTKANFEKFEQLNIPSSEIEVQDVMNNVQSCEVCALGAVFVCAVKRANKLKMEEIGEHELYVKFGLDSNQISPYIDKFFSPTQRMLIENAFEMYTVNNKIDMRISEEIFMTAVKYNRGFHHRTSSNMRMIRIMKNIIRNKGTFDPLDKTK